MYTALNKIKEIKVPFLSVLVFSFILVILSKFPAKAAPSSCINQGTVCSDTSSMPCAYDEQCCHIEYTCTVKNCISGGKTYRYTCTKKRCNNTCDGGCSGTPCIGDDDDPPDDPPDDPNIWYGVFGTVWSDFNNNGTRDEGEDWKGLPQYDTDGRCAPTTHQQDFSVTVNGENVARAWWCVGTPRIHTTRFEYYSHHDVAPGWVGLNAGMSRGNYYTATLGNLPAGSACGTYKVYNSDGSLQGSGQGCNASFLMNTVNNYIKIDWKLGLACTPTNGTLSAWSTCSTSCGPGTQTATCTKEATCGGTTCSTLCSNAGGTYSGTTCTRSCNLGPCNQNPKGNFDSVSCGSDPTSPNFHKIRVRGWACDPDNYSSPISVHVYNGTSSSGTKIGSGTANLPGELAIGSHCGGTTSHRFDILSAGTFAPGTYSINTYGINTPPGTNPLLSSSPKSVTCCAPTNGSLGAWGTCTGGTHVSTCVGFSCGGNCSAECSAEKGTYNPSTHVCTRNCLYVEGNIWSDWNGDGTRQLSETFKSSSLSGCSTTSIYNNFYLWYTGETGNQLRSWWCHSSLGAYYNSGTANIEPEKPHKFSISSSQLPANHTCGTWEYWTSAGKQGSGNGCVTDTFTMPVSGWQNVHWKLNCTVNQGTLSPWSECSGGKQTRTCNGATCCGTNCGNCNGAPLERDCLRLDGNIWSDDDGDGKELSDYWKRSLYSPSGCGTSKTFPNFYMTISNETPPNQIAGWFCHSNPSYGAYYNSPVPNAIEPESTKSVTLSFIPPGYNFVSWQYITQASGGSVVREGSGSFAPNLPMPSYGWVNVHWKLAQKKYNLKLKVREIPPERSAETSLCSSSEFNTFDVMPGASVTIKNSTGSTILCSGISNSNGEFTCPIWIYQGKVLIEVRKDVGGNVPETYTMRCPGVNSYLFEPPSPPPEENTTINLNIGLQTIYKKGWVSAIDADVFADRLNVTVPDGPTNNSSPGQIYQGFAKTLINSSFNNNNYLGFIFSQSDDISNPDIERGCPSKKGFETNTSCDTEYGGYAYDLMHFGQEHKSIWLENFDFSSPSSAETLNSLPNTFGVGKIYQISSDKFNERLGSGSDYSYTITSSGGEGIAILYVNGNSEINVNIKTTSTSKGRLLLVINGSLTVGSNVGTNIISFQMSGNPNIMAGIIAKDQITFQSRGGSITPSNFDKPIMVSAPLVSRAGISFRRDLYHDNNAVIPAESAKFFGKYLYYISNLEREKSSSYLYYTGVSTYDLDWEYIY